jgi:GNAT superfamily N-acetyltransferase
MSHATLQRATLRHDLRPGDLGRVVEQHGMLYAAEYGLDITMERYIAETIAELGKAAPPDRDRLWIAEIDGRMAGSIGIIGREGGAAQLRWFLVAPEARGQGLGGRLIEEALAFCREAGFRSVYLWTLHILTDAARLYLRAGFQKTEVKPPVPLWGRVLSEGRYDLSL